MCYFFTIWSFIQSYLQHFFLPFFLVHKLLYFWKVIFKNVFEHQFFLHILCDSCLTFSFFFFKQSKKIFTNTIFKTDMTKLLVISLWRGCDVKFKFKLKSYYRNVLYFVVWRLSEEQPLNTGKLRLSYGGHITFLFTLNNKIMYLYCTLVQTF